MLTFWMSVKKSYEEAAFPLLVGVVSLGFGVIAFLEDFLFLTVFAGLLFAFTWLYPLFTAVPICREQRGEYRKAHPSGVYVKFSVFEGAYSRNPTNWKLYNNYAVRLSTKTVFLFDPRNFAKYARFMRRIEDAARVREDNQRLAAEFAYVDQLRKEFEAAPAEFVAGKRKTHTFVFVEPEKKYEALMRDVADYRAQKGYQELAADYETSVVG